MKILSIHNFHRAGSASGDDQVFRSETELLEQKGNTVIRYMVSNDSFDEAGPVGKILATAGMCWSFRHYRAVRELILREKPDVVHVHTFFPLLSPSVLYAAKRCGVPVAATLHDTRLICPCCTSLRDGRICNDCIDGRYLRMVRHGCFKNSRLQSLIVAAVFKYHRLRKSFYRQIDRYICLNDIQMHLLGEAGFDRGRMVKKYNFVHDPAGSLTSDLPEDLPERYAVFYGRIGEEKGIRNLMKIWERIPEIPLVVMGAGPLEEAFRDWAERQPNVHFLGYVPHDRCLAIAAGGEFVVFPSIWYEGCSMVEIESESLGLALVATDLGFSAEAIEDGVNGCLVPLGDLNAFADCIRRLWADPARCRQMGRNAREDYEAKYCPEENYTQLMEIYREAAEPVT